MSWQKGRLHTQEEKEKIRKSVSLALKGIKLSTSHRKKLSEVKKRMFLEGRLKIPNNIGRRASEATKKKLSEIRLGRKLSEQAKEKLRKRIPWNKNLNKENNLIIKESSIKISKNNSRYWLGKKLPLHVVELMSIRGKIFAGEKNPAWIDGRSFEPYTKEFNKDFKLRIRTRDGFKCFLCSLSEVEHRNNFGCNLHVHHINYNKKDTFENNCCSLCSRCNSIVNSNRGYWIKFFQDKLFNTQASLENNSKIILTEKGINPNLLIGELPLKKAI